MPRITILSAYNGKAVNSAVRDMRKWESVAIKANNKVAAAMFNAAGKMQAAGAKMSQAGSSLTTSLTLPLAAVGGYAVKTAADFETSMAQVQAATDAPAAQMKELGELAKQMGADTIYSANEAAGAMLELAKSGMSPAEIQAGGLEAALQLAAAGGVSLESAATTASNAINMFGLDAEDAASVADAFAGGANASSASVESLQQALSQVGPAARNAGLTLNDTVGVLAAFADKGIQGSDAGTSLKTMLTRLVPATDAAAKAMEAYGLNFVDSKGNIDDITVVAEKLQKRLGKLSEAQRSAALTQIFGSDATRAATVLMQEGSEGIEAYIVATQDLSAAEKMAAARMSGINGALEQMRGSVETAALTFGEGLAPTVLEAAGSIKELADRFAELTPKQQEMIVKLTLTAAAAGPVLSVLGKLTTTLGSLTAAIGKTVFWLGSGGLAGALATAGTAAGHLGAAISLLAGGASLSSIAGLGTAGVIAAGGVAVLTTAIGVGLGLALNSLNERYFPRFHQWLGSIGEAIAGSDDEFNDFERFIYGLGPKVELTTAAQRTAAGVTSNLAGAHNDAAKAARDQADAEAGLAGSLNPLRDLEIRSLEAKRRLKDAQKEYKRAVEDSGKSSDNARLALLRMQDADATAKTAKANFRAEVKKSEDFVKSYGKVVDGVVTKKYHSATFMVGKDAARGLARGLDSGSGTVAAASLRLVNNSIERTMRKGLESNSPAKVTMRIGRDAGKGVEIGLRNSEKGIESAAEKLTDRITKALDRIKEHAQALRDRSADISGTWGLFGAPDGEKVTGAQILGNMTAQVAKMQQWQANLASLASKGVSGALMGELRASGPGSASQIAALDSLSDAELAEYARLYGTRSQLGAMAAERELGKAPKTPSVTIAAGAVKLTFNIAGNANEKQIEKAVERALKSVTRRASLKGA